ncbi:MAG: hypothetical protein EZS28_026048, partial [Streblomastix strix]
VSELVRQNSPKNQLQTRSAQLRVPQTSSMKNYISCIGGVLRAGPTSASVTVISRSLANPLVSLTFASLSSIRGQLGVILRPALSRNQTEHPVPVAHLAISKQRRGARVSEGDGLQQSPLGDD